MIFKDIVDALDRERAVQAVINELPESERNDVTRALALLDSEIARYERELGRLGRLVAVLQRLKSLANTESNA